MEDWLEPISKMRQAAYGLSRTTLTVFGHGVKLTSRKRSRSEENGFTVAPCFLKKLLRRDTRFN